ncbi:MAG: hypothetical protein UW75_C0040G0001 [Parcubacteria group bacterium GW2011_GWF2_44_8]|nr:MAG: hypothetical protein UW75_C0040G0001 [Parcubacteria group bacterium GW2011_GWF2_44_8]
MSNQQATISPTVLTVLGFVSTILLMGGIWLAVKFISPKISQQPDKSSTVEAQASPTPEPSPTPTPKPTIAPTKKPAAQKPTVSCDTFAQAAPSSITIRLVPRSGQMVGSTVVRLKPSGKCPGSTTSEHWMGPGEREWTQSGVGAGTYVIEVANGNYQGVIRQAVTVQGNSSYVFTVQVEG